MNKVLETVQWGMIGCGDVTEVKSGPAFSQVPGSRLVAVMARTEARVKDYAARHKVPKWYTDAQKLVDDPEVNAVYVATPPSTHLEYTLMAAAAGKPVYVEKPMACRHAECLRMIEACEKAGVPLFVAYYRRAQPRFLKVKELLDSGAIGLVRLAAISLWLPPRPQDRQSDALPWRVKPEISGGGYFYDVASHELDLLDFFLGPIAEADGLRANQAGWYTPEDVVSASFRFESGAMGVGSWCFTAAPKTTVDRVELTGSEGRIIFSCFGATPVRLEKTEGEEPFDILPPKTVQQPLIETVVAELQGRGACPSTGRTAARTNRIMEAICARPMVKV